jgi:hypothetical protein
MLNAKNLAALVIVAALSITSVRFKISADGLEIELHKTQQKLAAAQDNFYLAGECSLSGDEK